MRVVVVIAALLIAQTVALADEPASHVQTRLIANVSAIQSGHPFMLGVELTIDPGWHVYWKNPGDSGLPTRVKFSAPDGFAVGELLFPVPSKLEQPGGIVNFGYENKVLLMAEVTPSGKIAFGDQTQFKFSAAVSWLVCQDVCIPGKANLDLVIPADVLSKSTNSELFDPWIKAVPVPPKQLFDDVAGVDVQSDPYVVKIVWKDQVPGDIELFPGATDDYEIKDVTITRSGDNTTSIAFSARLLTGKSPPNITLDSVVAYKDRLGQRRGIAIGILLPAPQL